MHLCSWVRWSTLAIWVHYSQHFFFPEAFLFQKHSSFPKAIIFSKSFPFSKQIPLGPCFWIKTFLEKYAFGKECFQKRILLEKNVFKMSWKKASFNLRKPSIFFVGTVEICMSLIIDQWPKQNLWLDAQPEIWILKVI